MATEEDDFDIDIYGDGGEEAQQESGPNDLTAVETPQSAVHIDNPEQQSSLHEAKPALEPKSTDIVPQSDVDDRHPDTTEPQKIVSTDASASASIQLPKQAPQAQGLVHKDGSEDVRPVDPSASTALLVSDLHWWVNDDDVRGWSNQCRCEDELREVTFSEHKVNGKSKGQVYVLFNSPQAATATKRKIESFSEGQQYVKKFTVTYSNPSSNPFKTHPKDGLTRGGGPASSNRGSSGNYGGVSSSQPTGGFGNASGGYRGGRGSFNNRGGGMNNNYNRGGFSQSTMNGFPNNPMSNVPSYGGFQNRGGMMAGMRGPSMNMRGGRGAMMGMPMNGMGFGAMGMGVNMPQMAGMGLQGAFQATQAHFNPAMFNQYGGAMSDTGWNPHGAKRPRQE